MTASKAFSVLVLLRALIGSLFTLAPLLFLVMAIVDLLVPAWLGRHYYPDIATPRDPPLFITAVVIAVLALPVGLVALRKLPQFRFDTCLGAVAGWTLGAQFWQFGSPGLADILYAADWPELRRWTYSSLTVVIWLTIVLLAAGIWRAVLVAAETRRRRMRPGLPNF